MPSDIVRVRVMNDPHHRDFGRTLRISDNGITWHLIDREDIYSISEITQDIFELQIAYDRAMNWNMEIVND